MAVQWIIGRAGTGKTHCCIAAIKAEVQRNPLGPPIYLLVPEQAAFMTERRLVTGDTPLRGSFRIRVAGIRRFCRLVSPQLGLPEQPDLTPIRRTILLVQTLRQCRGRLTIFKTIADRPGFLKILDTMLTEWEQNGQTAATLRQLGRQAGADPILAAKLGDMAILLETWDQIAAPAMADSGRFVATTAGALADSDALMAYQIYVDSFSSFNAQETRLIGQLGRRTENLTITLLADPQSAAIQDPDQPLDELGTFYRTQLLYRRLSLAFAQAGAEVRPIKALLESRRFAAPLLAEWESCLSRSGDAPPDPIPPQIQSAAIEVWSGADAEAEVLAVARHIQRCTGNGMRYRDMGLVVGDMPQYEDMITRIFTARNIPFFLDRRAGLTHHPLLELLRGAMGLAAGDRSRTALLAFVKTRLTGVPPADTAALENYLIAHGLDDCDLSRAWQWHALPTDPVADEPSQHQRSEMAAANRSRQLLFAALQPWLACAQADAPAVSGGGLASALIELIERMEVKETLEKWISAERAAGNPQMAQIHEQAWGQTLLALQEMRTLLPQGPMPLDEFAQLLFSTLENITLGLVPPAPDQVLVSSATRSRHPELRHVIVLGVVETQFPKVTTEDPMLDNRQRRLLNTISEGCVNPGSDDNLLQARFFDYIAFTRSSEKLILTWPQKDSQGARTIPSTYLEQLEKAFAVRSRPVQITGLAAATCATDILDGVTTGLIAARNGGSLDHAGEPAADLLAAYTWLRHHTDPSVSQAVRQAWDCLAPKNPASVAAPYQPDAARRLKQISISQLQTAAACRLQYFLKYTLGLRPQAKLMMDAITLGQIYHQILEQFYRGIIDIPLYNNHVWPDWPPETIAARLDAAMAAQTVTLEKEMFAGQPETRVMLATIRRNLLLLLEAHHQAALRNQFRPTAVEQVFGDPNAASFIPGFFIEPAAGTILPVRGKIDRLDTTPDGAAIVLDYKTSSGQKFNAVLMEAGLDLQLIGYLMALQKATRPDGTELQPVGAFYQFVRGKAETMTSKGEAISPADAKYYKPCLPRGLFDSDFSNALETGSVQNRKGNWFSISYTKEGAPARRGHDGVSAEQFAQLLRIARKTMERLAGEILSGSTIPAPFRLGTKTACTHCDFENLCPFDRQYGHYRKIPAGISGINAIESVLIGNNSQADGDPREGN